MQSSTHLRGDCADGRYNHLHADWATDHVVAYPGLVPILASSLELQSRPIHMEGHEVTIGQARMSIIVGLKAMVKLKDIKQLRLYTHEDCGFYAAVLGKNPNFDELQHDLDFAVRTVKATLPHICVKGHVVTHDGDGWTVDKPLAVAR